MSAFLVSNRHISVILRACLKVGNGSEVRWRKVPNGRCSRLDHLSADETGRMLLRENYRSVNSRYPDSPADAAPAEEYRFPVFMAAPTPVEALRALSCYEYQACECPDWEETEAARFCRAAQGYLITQLPGYESAPWCWDEEAPIRERI